ELWSRGALAGRITNHSGEIADEKDRNVAQFLKRAQFADYHGVAEVNIGRGRIRAEFYAQRLAGFGRFLEFRTQFFLTNYFRGPFAQVSELFIYGHHSRA